MIELLCLEAVTKYFDGVCAVGEISMVVPAGGFVAVVGPNGAGKTTLLDLVGGACRPDAGSVWFAGRDITGWPAHQVCAVGIGRTFELPQPFAALSVEDNVIMGALLRDYAVAEARHRAGEVLERLGLSALSRRPAASLSLAGRKRLDLARAVATKPRLLLLDEPLAGLSPDERDDMMAILRALNQRRRLAVLMTEHRLVAVADLADHVVILDHGQAIACGTPRELANLAADGVTCVPGASARELP
ncbi:MAG: ABC transporter ATP-binding protein [Rhodospirillaceae bacterium]